MLKKAFILAVGLSLVSTAAKPQDSVLWKSIGEWDISIDTTVGNGCYALASWSGGTVLRIGLNPVKDNFYFLVGNPNWDDLRHDTEYDIQIKFGAKPAWDVSARGLQFAPGETVFLHAQSNKEEFLQEFMRQSYMKISRDGKEIEKIKLSGSSRAFKGVRACQEDVTANGVPGAKPVATPSVKPSPKSGKKTSSGRKSSARPNG